MPQNINQKQETYKIIKSKKYPILRAVIKTIFILILISFILILVIGGVVGYKVYEIAQDTKLSRNDLVIEYENSIVKDINGNVIAILNGNENRESISISEMPEYLPKAFVAIEDERFYEHKGVDIKRSLRAAYIYIKNDGKSPFGGSTITQQMIKNITQEKEDTWQRKVKEMTRAYYIEKEMSKNEILELYLNLIFLGDTVYGVQKGSNYYFNKDASELNLAECAFLAGINHSPNSYNPFIQEDEEVLEKIKERTKTVLNKMYELGKIETEQEYLEAIKETNRGLNFQQGVILQTIFSYHTDAALTQIINELKEKNDWTYEQAKLYLFGGGFTIYTTINPEIQSIMNEELNNEKYRITAADANGYTQESQAAMVLIDHKTGYVLAIYGGLGEKTTAFGFNRATDGKKQTGSSMKPLAVLAPCINEGIITAGTIFDDSQTSFDDGKFNPKNYGYSYKGLINVRSAIGYSQNIPMVKAMCLLTPSKSIGFLKSVGITSIDEEKDNGLALSLGGLTWGITPLEMAGAYATIANDGIYIKPTFYTKVVDSNGNVIIEANQTTRRIMSSEAAYVVKEILTEPVKNGTSKRCAIEGMSVAAKTGTTNNDYDRWLCGFTPYYTSTTWFGYDNNATVKYDEYNPAALIWIEVMTRSHQGLEVKTFNETIPEGIVTATICKKSGFLATSSCKSYGTSYEEYFVLGTEPIQTCPYHSGAKICTESGLLANENCKNTRTVYGRGEYIDSNGLWKTNTYYGNSNNIPIQNCTIHGIDNTTINQSITILENN